MLNQVNRLLDDLLDRGYDTAARSVLDAVAANVRAGRVAQRLDELDIEARRLTDAGDRLRPDNPVLAALLADLDRALVASAGAVDDEAQALQLRAAEASRRLTRELALPGLSDAALARIGIRWTVPDPEAVNALIGFANSAAWQAEMGAYPARVVQVVRNQAIRGIASGWNPLRAAKAIRQTAESIPVAQANNLMRTLYLQSYRRGNAIHQQANADILDGQIRVGVLDQRTCLACIALHGTRLPVGEVVIDHHQGRCTSIPIVKGRPREIVTGEMWFQNLTDEQKADMAAFRRSPGKLAALQSGKARLEDFVQYYTDPVFGRMVREGGLGGALGGTPGGGGRSPSAPTVPGITPDGTPTGVRILTGDGYRQDDATYFSDIETVTELTAYAFDDSMPRVFAMWETDALGFDDSGNLTLDAPAYREYVKRYVRQSRSIDISRDRARQIIRDVLRDDFGVTVTPEQAEQVINGDMARQADALLKLSDVFNVRLTDPQRRRLNTARSGGYMDMQYAEFGDSGTIEADLARARERSSGIRRDSAEYRRLKDDFDRIMDRGQYAR